MGEKRNEHREFVQTNEQAGRHEAAFPSGTSLLFRFRRGIR